MFNGVTIQWKEEMNKAKARIIETEPFTYSLEIVQEFDDDRYHDELPIISKIPVISIEKIFYTVSSKLLKINEESNPVLVLKLKDSKQEWIAIELYDYLFKNNGLGVESESEESEEDLVSDVEKLKITPKSDTPFQTPFYSKPETPLSTPRTPSKVPSRIPTSLFDSPTPKTPAKHNTPGVDTPSVFTVTTVNQKLNDLCLLESILRLSILENLENKRVYEVDEDTLHRYIEK